MKKLLLAITTLIFAIPLIAQTGDGSLNPTGTGSPTTPTGTGAIESQPMPSNDAQMEEESEEQRIIREKEREEVIRNTAPGSDPSSTSPAQAEEEPTELDSGTEMNEESDSSINP